MQTDLQVLLLIIALVCAGYWMFTAIKSRRLHQTEDPTSLPNTTSSISDTLFASSEDPLFVDHMQPAVASYADKVDEAEYSSIQQEPVKQLDSKIEKPTPEYVILSILAKEQMSFTGHLLLSVLRANKFHYGKQKIFHRHIEDNPTLPALFSVASLTEPGIFERHQLANQRFVGILMWMELTQSEECLKIFETFVNTAKQLAFALNGILCDGERHALNAQTIANLRMRVRKAIQQPMATIAEVS